MGGVDKFLASMYHWCREMDMHYGQGNASFPRPRYDFSHGGSTDCSAMVAHCLNEAGWDVSPYIWSGNTEAALKNVGWTASHSEGYPPRGSVLVNTWNHVAVAWDGNGSIIEWGADPHDGYNPGPHGWYDYPWSVYLVPPEDSDKLTPPADWVRRLQAECNAQGFSDQPVDGVPGSMTLAGCCPLRRGDEGNITHMMQEILEHYGYYCGGADGVFGEYTERGVLEFQKARGITADGWVGTETWREILGL